MRSFLRTDQVNRAPAASELLCQQLSQNLQLEFQLFGRQPIHCIINSAAMHQGLPNPAVFSRLQRRTAYLLYGPLSKAHSGKFRGQKGLRRQIASKFMTEHAKIDMSKWQVFDGQNMSKLDFWTFLAFGNCAWLRRNLAWGSGGSLAASSGPHTPAAPVARACSNSTLQQLLGGKFRILWFQHI